MSVNFIGRNSPEKEPKTRDKKEVMNVDYNFVMEKQIETLDNLQESNLKNPSKMQFEEESNVSKFHDRLKQLKR